MSYGKDFTKAAKRHYCAGEVLFEESRSGAQPGCRAVAGYLYGLAGELAVKSMMRSSGIKSKDVPRDHPYYAHFPQLKHRLRDHIQGRRSAQLREVVDSANLFQNWDVSMRYAPTSDIETSWVEKWRESAGKLLDRMGAI